MVAPKKNLFNEDGRPVMPFNHVLFERLCFIHCTINEIAGVMRVNEETLYIKVKEFYNEEFPKVYTRFAADGKSSLRRIQFDLAKKNAAMAIFLGKNYLGQKEAPVEYVVPNEFIQPFDNLMTQIKNLQSDRKKDESTNSSE